MTPTFVSCRSVFALAGLCVIALTLGCTSSPRVVYHIDSVSPPSPTAKTLEVRIAEKIIDTDTPPSSAPPATSAAASPSARVIRQRLTTAFIQLDDATLLATPQDSAARQIALPVPASQRRLSALGQSDVRVAGALADQDIFVAGRRSFSVPASASVVGSPGGKYVAVATAKGAEIVLLRNRQAIPIAHPGRPDRLLFTSDESLLLASYASGNTLLLIQSDSGLSTRITSPDASLNLTPLAVERTANQTLILYSAPGQVQIRDTSAAVISQTPTSGHVTQAFWNTSARTVLLIEPPTNSAFTLHLWDLSTQSVSTYRLPLQQVAYLFGTMLPANP